MSTFPEIKVRADSEFWIKTNGLNKFGQYGLFDDNGEPYTNTDVTVFATVYVEQSLVVTLLNLPLEFVTLGYWRGRAPSSVCRHGLGPWVQKVEVFDSSGLVGVKLATFYNSLTEDNSIL